MSKIVTPYHDTVDKLFQGVMISVTGEANKPGWKCRTCGWTIGSIELPPSHVCPDDGIRQSEKRTLRMRQDGHSPV